MHNVYGLSGLADWMGKVGQAYTILCEELLKAAPVCHPELPCYLGLDQGSTCRGTRKLLFHRFRIDLGETHHLDKYPHREKGQDKLEKASCHLFGSRYILVQQLNA